MATLCVWSIQGWAKSTKRRCGRLKWNGIYSAVSSGFFVVVVMLLLFLLYCSFPFREKPSIGMRYEHDALYVVEHPSKFEHRNAYITLLPVATVEIFVYISTGFCRWHHHRRREQREPRDYVHFFRVLATYTIRFSSSSSSYYSVRTKSKPLLCSLRTTKIQIRKVLRGSLTSQELRRLTFNGKKRQTSWCRFSMCCRDSNQSQTLR